MSTTVDEKVVEMRFDNSNFDKNVKDSISQLDELKRSLKLDDVTNGFESVQSSVNGMNFGVVGSAVETVTAKFTALEVMAVTALQRITNQAIDTGQRLVKSLSTDQIASGWDKYAQKTTAVQTIMAATSKDFEDQGVQMEFVNEQLDKLNWFTDETSYNFVDMVSNIGKFTSNGVKLDQAVAAMEGIATWTSLSGGNANEASRAMYNLSQAISVGAVKLMDWRSIENANMATVEFKEAAVEAAVAAGTLTRGLDGTLKTAKGTAVSVKDFNSALSEGWFTSEVLLDTLGQYGDFANEVSDAMDQMNTSITTSRFLSFVNDFKEGTLDMDAAVKATGLSAAELTPILEKLADDQYNLGRKSFAAAQEAKTFGEAIDSAKDAVSTGWMNTFENVFGGYDKAKVVWTELANRLYDVFAEGGNRRNEILQLWNQGGGADDLIQSFWNLWDGIANYTDTIKDAFHSIFPESTVIDAARRLYSFTSNLKTVTENFKNIDAAVADKLSGTFKGFFAVLDIGKQAIMAVGNACKPLIEKLGSVAGIALGLTGSFGEWLAALDETIRENNVFGNAIASVSNVISSAGNKIADAFQKITGMTLGDAFENLKAKAMSMFESLKESFSGFASFDFSGFDSFKSYLSNKLSSLSPITDGIVVMFMNLAGSLSGASPVLTGIFSKISEGIKAFGNAISSAFTGDGFSNLLDVAGGGVLVTIGIKISQFIGSLREAVDNNPLGQFQKIMDSVSDSLEAFTASVNAKSLLTIAGAIAVLAAALLVVSKIDEGKLAGSLAAVGVEFGGLIVVMNQMSKISDASSMTKVATSLLIFSAAVSVLTGAVEDLGKLKLSDAAQGVVAVLALSEILAHSAKQISKNTDGLFSGAAGMILFAEAIRLLVKPVEELGALDLGTLAKGLGSVGILMAELAVFTRVSDLSNTGVSTAIGIIGISAAIRILASAVEDFASMSLGELATGLIAMGLAMAELSIFVNSLGDTESMVAKGVAMVAFGASMLIFAESIHKMGSMELTEATQGLAVAAGILTAVAVAANAMTSALPGAAAILVVSSAMAVLAPVLKTFGSMSPGEIAKGLITLAGAFTVLGVAGAILGPITPALLGLGAAVTLLGVGALACGAGVSALAVGLTLLGTGGAAGITALGVALVAIVSMIPALFESLGAGVVAFVDSIAAGMDSIVTAIVQIVNGVISAISETVPNIVKAGMELVKGLLKGIEENIGEITSSFIGILVEILNAISDKLPEFINAGVNLMINFIDGLASAIEENAEKARDAFEHLVESIISAAVTMLGGNGPEFVAKGKELLDKLKDGFKNGFPEFFDKLKEFGNNIVESIKSKVSDFKEAGKQWITNLKDGIASKWEEAKAKMAEIVVGILLKIVEKYEDIKTKGATLISNLKQGLANKMSEIKTQAQNIVSKIIGAISDKYNDIKSKAETLMTNVKTGIANKMSEIKTQAQNLVTNIVSAVSDKYNDIKSKAETLMTNVKTGIANKMSEIKSQVTTVISGAVTAVSDKASEFLAKGEALMTNLKTGISNKISELKEKGTEIMNAILDALEGVLSHFGPIGEAIIDKIRGGVDANAYEVKDAVQDAVDDAKNVNTSGFENTGAQITNGLAAGVSNQTAVSTLNTAVDNVVKGALQAANSAAAVQSPSRKTMVTGAYMTEGLAIGILKESSLVDSAAERVTKTAIKTFSETISLIADFAEEGLDTQPVIAPVLDLSNVSEGVSALNTMMSANRAYAVAGSMESQEAVNQNGVFSPTGSTINFTQNNYSPKALTRLEIYRQTRNQLSAFERTVTV